MTAARVTIVTVSYNSAAVLAPMLASCPQGVPVVVVDNASSDMSGIRAVTARHGATLIENPENLGFGTACNIGAARAETEFILFLNPDATLAETTLDQLLATADAHPDASAVNPVTLGENGAPALKRKSDLIPKSEFLSRQVPDRDRRIPTLNGAAFLVRTCAFRGIGGFDPNIFLFFEDDDLGERLRQSCGPLMLSHAAQVIHDAGNASSGPRLAGEVFKAWHMGFSRLYTMRKHHRPLARTRALTHALLRVLSPTLFFSKSHRAKRIAFLRGTFAALSRA